MAKRVINSLNAGELSPYLYARSDVDKYQSGCLVMENFVPLVQGGATRRPSLEYKFASVDDDKVRLVPFTFSVSDTYLLVIGDNEINIYQDTTLKDTLVAPWGEDELDEIKYTQSADVMWLVHPDYPVQRLERTSDTSWSIADVEWDYPPLLDENDEEIYLDFEFSETAWVGSTTYNIGDMRQFEGVVYRCIESHSSDPSLFRNDFKRGYWMALNEGVSATCTAYTSRGLDTLTPVYDWIASTGTAGEFYLALTGGGNPNITEPDMVKVDYDNLSAGTLGALGNESFAWGDNEAVPLGFNTVYVKLTGSADPDTKTDVRILNHADVFTSSQVGSQYSVSNPLTQELVGSDNTGTTVGTCQFSERSIVYNTTPYNNGISVPINASNSNWELSTDGTWNGLLKIERSDDFGENWFDYVVVGDTTGGAGKNFSTSSDSPEPARTLLRINFNPSGVTSLGITFELKNTLLDGLFTIDSYNNTHSVDVTVDLSIQKELSVGNQDNSNVISQGATTSKVFSEGAFSSENGFPKSISIFENRLSFGGTTSAPNRLWMSQTDDFQNFLKQDVDTGSIDITINSKTVDEIRWMIPQEKLVIGTAGGEWTLGASDERKPITPTGFDLKGKSSYGSSNLQAVLVNSDIIFQMRQGEKVREWPTNFSLQEYIAPDKTVLAEHITRGGVFQWDYQQQPDSILWCIRNDGELIGFTYEREQSVMGWHRHANDEFDFESVAVLPRDNEEDEVWVSVKITVNGVIKRHIARLTDREWGTDHTTEWQGSDLWVDYQSAGDANHLIGKTVTLVVDGVPQGTQVVDGSGNITGATGTANIVGLPFTSILAPLYFVSENQYGTSRGGKVAARDGVVRFKDTYSAKVGRSATDLEDPLWNSDNSPLYNEDVLVKFDSSSEYLRTMYIVQSEPMPCTVLAMVPNVEVR
jgi:hypothetical protein